MFAVGVFEEGIGSAISIEAHDGGNDRRIANGAIGVEDAVNVAPFVDYGELPEIPAHVAAVELLNGHVVGVGAADASNLGVEDRLVYRGGEGLGLCDVSADLGTCGAVVVEGENVNRLGGLLHAGDVNAPNRDGDVGSGGAEEIGGVACDDQGAGAGIRAVAGSVVRLVRGIPELEGRLLRGKLDDAFEPGLEFGREIGARRDRARLVDQAEHHTDVVPLAGMKKVEEVAVGQFRIGLPGAVRDEDTNLVEIETLSVSKVALNLGTVIFEPKAGVSARTDRGIE